MVCIFACWLVGGRAGGRPSPSVGLPLCVCVTRCSSSARQAPLLRERVLPNARLQMYFWLSRSVWTGHRSRRRYGSSRPGLPPRPQRTTARNGSSGRKLGRTPMNLLNGCRNGRTEVVAGVRAQSAVGGREGGLQECAGQRRRCELAGTFTGFAVAAAEARATVSFTAAVTAAMAAPPSPSHSAASVHESATDAHNLSAGHRCDDHDVAHKCACNAAWKLINLGHTAR